MKIIGSISLPGDKSISHRYAMLAAIAKGKSLIENFPISADCLSTLSCLQALGVKIELDGTSLGIEGAGPRGLKPSAETLDAGNSGTTMRLLSGILAGQQFSTTITGDRSLRRRPMRRIIEPLTLMGAQVEATDGDHPPLHIRGGDLKAIDYALPVASAQVKSCVLLAGLYAEGETTVSEPARTRNHTEIALKEFGAKVSVSNRAVSIVGGAALRGRELKVPGDISSAAFLIAAALLLPGSEIIIRDVGLNETRTGLVRLLRSCGAKIEVVDYGALQGEPYGALKVAYSSEFFDSGPIKVSGDIAPEVIDEIPVLAILGTQMRDGAEIRDVAELRVKESDRIAALAENLRRMGADVEELQDGLRIAGGQRLRGASITTYGDHRIAMAFSIAGLIAEGRTEIDDTACIGISFPDFLAYLQRLVR